MFLNAATDGCRHKTGMSQPSTMVDRLLAHARICREIASTTLNRQTARELELLAEDCIQAARDAEPAPRFQRFPSQAAG
jgi:hypothetical protein